MTNGVEWDWIGLLTVWSAPIDGVCVSHDGVVGNACYSLLIMQVSVLPCPPSIVRPGWAAWGQPAHLRSEIAGSQWRWGHGLLDDRPDGVREPAVPR